MPTAAELERLGATIGRVDVYVQNIFDVGDPREDNGLYRLADHLHVESRERTVRDQLLFAPGQPVVTQKLEETERILRSRIYLSEAWVVPVRYDAEHKVVDLAVTVRDVWTLNPSISLGRAGGDNATQVGLEEENLLGTGTSFEIARARNVDRSSTLFSLQNPNVAGSWWSAGLNYADNSDGRVKSLNLDHPFYSLDSRDALGIDLSDGTSRVSRYSTGVIADQFDVRHTLDQVYYGWSQGLVDGWTQRWSTGLRYDDTTFAPAPGVPPPIGPLNDRKFVYPYAGWQLVEDRYEKTENLTLIGRTEDIYVGRSLYAELGYSTQGFGGHGSSILSQANGNEAWHFGPQRELLLTGSFAGRLDDGVAHNVSLTSATQFFDRLTSHQVFYVSLSGTTSHRLDTDQQLLLGGDSGLRGYPIRFQGGTSSALLTVEQRLYTDWFPFRLVRIGGVAFFDAGRTWGPDYLGAEPLGLLRDVGLGLRIGNVRSGLGNVVHIDLSYALDAPPGIRRVQVTVATKSTY